MDHCEVTIIGAGVVGLAIASELSKEKYVVVLEKNDKFGIETSSRNSEIIHAGIYYPKNSLKAKLCVEGNPLLYETCDKNHIPYDKIGKLVVATNESDLIELEKLLENGKNNGATLVEIISEKELKKLEPNVSGKAALYAGSTGIVDVHALMDFFYNRAKSNGVIFASKSEVTEIEKTNNYKITVNSEHSFTSEIVINAAGLYADKIARLAGINEPRYKIHFCKGEYFIARNSNGKLNHLVFPLPQKKLVGLGIHSTLDLSGQLRLGPNAFYVGEINYGVDESHKREFFESGKQYLPFLREEDLQAGFAGIRPKLQGPGEDYRDFTISHESERGFTGFINLIGIESPGLTCAQSIALHVKNMISKF